MCAHGNPVSLNDLPLFRVPTAYLATVMSREPRERTEGGVNRTFESEEVELKSSRAPLTYFPISMSRAMKFYSRIFTFGFQSNVLKRSPIANDPLIIQQLHLKLHSPPSRVCLMKL